MSLAASDFDYELPPELIAQHPAPRRDQSRLMVVNRAERSVRHHSFSEIGRFFREGDQLFRNNASVLPARLRGQRPSRGKVECLLLERRPGANQAAEMWRCLLKPGRRLGPGAEFAGPGYRARVVAWEAEGMAVAEITTDGESVVSLARREGEVPLPPYIASRKRAEDRAQDRERYQTVYADPGRPVAAAAPTAGLHFTPELFAGLQARGVQIRDLTLHVGLGTFRPIATERIEDHPIHAEAYELPVETQRALFAGLRRIAVGTTVVRSIEDFLSRHPAPLERAHADSASIFLYPPRTFRGVDALVTNFHQPRSTLLCLVAAFLTPGSTEGVAWLKEIYAQAAALRYRFFSYGDAMLIL